MIITLAHTSGQPCIIPYNARSHGIHAGRLRDGVDLQPLKR